MAEKRSCPADYWRTEDGLTFLTAWARDGLTDYQIADKAGVSKDTIASWKRKYPEIRDAINTPKELVDYKVENALLKAALGYKTKKVKVTIGKKLVSGEAFQVLKETTEEEVPPNVMACLAWLNNRKFDQWKRNRDKVVEVDPEDQNVSITIIKGPGAGLGNNVNEAVKLTPLENNPKQIEEKNSLPTQDFINPPEGEKVPINRGVEASEEEDLDYWPDDWEDDDE